MSTKLTLQLDEELIAAAKRYARAQGRSVSVLVADYFAQLTASPSAAPPIARTSTKTITSQLRGALQNSNADERDYQRYLESKYL